MFKKACFLDLPPHIVLGLLPYLCAPSWFAPAAKEYSELKPLCFWCDPGPTPYSVVLQHSLKSLAQDMYSADVAECECFEWVRNICALAYVSRVTWEMLRSRCVYAQSLESRCSVMFINYCLKHSYGHQHGGDARNMPTHLIDDEWTALKLLQLSPAKARRKVLDKFRFGTIFLQQELRRLCRIRTPWWEAGVTSFADYFNPNICSLCVRNVDFVDDEGHVTSFFYETVPRDVKHLRSLRPEELFVSFR